MFTYTRPCEHSASARKLRRRGERYLGSAQTHTFRWVKEAQKLKPSSCCAARSEMVSNVHVTRVVRVRRRRCRTLICGKKAFCENRRRARITVHSERSISIDSVGKHAPTNNCVHVNSRSLSNGFRAKNGQRHGIQQMFTKRTQMNVIFYRIFKGALRSSRFAHIQLLRAKQPRRVPVTSLTSVCHLMLRWACTCRGAKHASKAHEDERLRANTEQHVCTCT